MSTENTIENNKLLAEFMDYDFEDGDFKVPHSNKTSNSDFKEWCPTYWDERIDSGGYLVAPCNLMFGSDWNWLMEVVEKIELVKNEDFTVHINRCNCMIVGYELYPQFHILEQSISKTQAVYNACIEFVKWYNKNKD